jgi:hypothetical protein
MGPLRLVCVAWLDGSCCVSAFFWLDLVAILRACRSDSGPLVAFMVGF